MIKLITTYKFIKVVISVIIAKTINYIEENIGTKLKGLVLEKGL